MELGKGKMKFMPLDGSVVGEGPGVFCGLMTFDNPTLAGYAWPVCDIRGAEAGPRLCVSAGVHVNEVSSIEAAIRLQRCFEPSCMKGSVSILPLVNLPAMFDYTQYNCPIDGKNINFTFPGDASGTFSEALCDAIQAHWCAGANCYVDMHGGDLRENVSKFSIFQRTGNDETDGMRQRLAMCFDAEIVAALPPRLMEAPGRPPTGFAREDRIALMSEAGANGVLDEECIAFHVEGVLAIARELGIITGSQTKFKRARILCTDYLWVDSPADGLFYAAAEPGQQVSAAQKIGEIRDVFGRILADVISPADGLMLWRMTHPLVKGGTPILAVGVPDSAARTRVAHI